jgi:hypothetical protein
LFDKAVHCCEGADRRGPERSFAALPALDVPVKRANRRALKRFDTNVGEELRRHHESRGTEIVGGGPCMREVSVRIPERAVNDDNETLDA